MAIVNYVRESIAFIEYASDNGITANERLLWYALFHIMNMRAERTVWPDGYISISNKRLLSYLPYSEDTLISARNRLTQREIIKYKPGQKNKVTPMYKMIYFSTSQHSYPQNEECYPQISGNMPGNIGGNTGGNMPGNMQGNMPDIKVNLNVTQNETTHTYSYDDAWRTSARVRSAVAQRILDAWEGVVSPGADVHWDIAEYLEKGMTPEQITETIKDCRDSEYIPFWLHTEALSLGIDKEGDGPNGY